MKSGDGKKPVCSNTLTALMHANDEEQMVWVAHAVSDGKRKGLTSAPSRCMKVDLGAHWPMKRDRLMERRELSNLVITEVVVVLIGRQP